LAHSSLYSTLRARVQKTSSFKRLAPILLGTVVLFGGTEEAPFEYGISLKGDRKWFLTGKKYTYLRKDR
jgi:hypothetical protein